MNKFLLSTIALIFCQLSVADVTLVVDQSVVDQAVADRVLVKKAEKKLFLVKDGKPFREFPIALGPKPKGHKVAAGDERTPEGSYILDFKNDESGFYKSIHISYPNYRDRVLAASKGVDPGGAIMIHGAPNDTTLPPELVQRFNWTNGCIAVTNREMDEIWDAVKLGTPIDILP